MTKKDAFSKINPKLKSQLESSARKLGSKARLDITQIETHMAHGSNVYNCMHIWSEYGDEIVVDKGQKLSKWGPSGRVSQRLSMKERGVKTLKKKKKMKKDSGEKRDKKPRSLFSRESEAQLQLQAE